MDFTISRESLLKPLQMVAGAVEKRQTLPVLSNVLMNVSANQLSMTATDLEVELSSRVELSDAVTPGTTTFPARKFIDICRNLPNESLIRVQAEANRAVITSGSSRFTLSTLPAEEFPQLADMPGDQEFNIPQKDLRYLIESTQFAMAQNDVRYYLNGLMLQLNHLGLQAVATDGHRLSMACASSYQFQAETKLIIPRKGVTELVRLLDDSDETITITITDNHIRAMGDDFTFTSKLIDGRFPDFERVIPKNNDKEILVDKDQLRNVLGRVAILSNEKYRGVRFQFRENCLHIQANNPEQEEAQEELVIDYAREELDIGFNVSYLQDVLASLPNGEIKLALADLKSSLLITSVADKNRTNVIMPMRV